MPEKRKRARAYCDPCDRAVTTRVSQKATVSDEYPVRVRCRECGGIRLAKTTVGTEALVDA